MRSPAAISSLASVVLLVGFAPAPVAAAPMTAAARAADSAPPALSVVTRLAPGPAMTVAASRTTPVKIRWTGSDTGGSGIRSVSVVYRDDASGFLRTVSWSGTATTGVASGLGPTNSPRSLAVLRVEVRDGAGNARRYVADGSAFVHLAGTPADSWASAGRHTLDLATLSYVTTTAPAQLTPSAPRGVTVSPRDRALRITWKAPASSQLLTVFRVTVTGGGKTRSITVPPSRTSLRVDGLVNRTPYTVRVRAVGGVSASPAAYVAPVSPARVRPTIPVTTGALPAVSASRSVAFAGTPTSAADRADVPVTGYVVQTVTAATDQAYPLVWSDLRQARPLPTATLFSAGGKRVCFRVVPANSVGRGPGSVPRCTAVPTDDAALVRSGTWTKVISSTSYDRTFSRSTVVGASLTAPKAFGKSVTVLARTSPGAGRLGVYVGARRIGGISLAASQNARIQRTFQVAVNRADVVLKVEAAGTGVDVDGLAVGLPLAPGNVRLRTAAPARTTARRAPNAPITGTLTSAGPTSEPLPNVTIRARLWTGTATPGAVVQTTVTGPDGSFTLVLPDTTVITGPFALEVVASPIAQGWYVASSGGYDVVANAGQFAAGAAVSVSVPLTFMTGRIIDRLGRPVVGALVSARDEVSPGVIQSTIGVTDAGGYFIVTGLTEEEYGIAVDASASGGPNGFVGLDQLAATRGRFIPTVVWTFPEAVTWSPQRFGSISIG